MGLNTLHIFNKFSSLCDVDGPILIAISGGSDSMALMRLYADFISKHSNNMRVHCVTINHGLRAEAMDEAQFVAEICAKMGFSHKTLDWQGDKPQSQLQARAREARHRLLRQEALSIGARHILLGHTLDDQTETYLMRKERSESLRGLAAMAPATLIGGDVWFARPLLTSTRQDLRDYLLLKQQRWVDDPSNQDMQFERVRIRSQMNDAPEAARLAAERQRCEEVAVAARFVTSHFSMMNAQEGAFSNLPPKMALSDGQFLAIRSALALIGARSYLASEYAGRDALSRLADGAVTLSGCVMRMKNETLLITREIRGGDGPEVHEHRNGSSLSLFDHYLPSFDLPLANAFAPFFGRNCYPRSPLG